MFWAALFLPLLGGLFLLSYGQRLDRRLCVSLACGTVGAAFVSAVLTFFYPPFERDQVLFRWLDLGSARVDFGAWIDPLSITMLLTVTGVAYLIHLYSAGYMAEEPDFARFFGYLNLFVAAMVMLVLANNFALLLLGWAGVGFASCMLIGFYAHKQSALIAARKAFVINTFGDLGLMLAVYVLANQGSVSFRDVLQTPSDELAMVVVLGLLVAAYAKSAQFPLHTWLPDAMEGPTPVSALIHAATMVTAGVYLLARCEPILRLVSEMGSLIAALGLLSAALAATCALAQTDLKRVLAYSTMSQLGYMFMACGVGAYGAAIFHLVTHAFFKALLFLSAGTIIHALHGEQNMFKMGGLARRAELAGARWCFLIGGLALAGLPPLAGYFSKEEILSAIEQNAMTESLFLGALLTAALTAFYVGRAYILVFWGQAEHGSLHGPTGLMSLACWVLALLTVGAGLVLGFPGSPALEAYLGTAPIPTHLSTGLLISFGTALPGFVLAYLMFARSRPVGPSNAAVFRLAEKGWALDEVQRLAVIAPMQKMGHLLGGRLEEVASHRLPQQVGQTAVRSGQELGLSQSGLLRTYALVLLTALLGVVTYLLWQVRT